VNKRGRPVIEEMGVIDEHHQRTPLRPPDHRPHVTAQQRTTILRRTVVTARVGRERRRERPERQPL
jgi:hypothetical protein